MPQKFQTSKKPNAVLSGPGPLLVLDTEVFKVSQVFPSGETDRVRSFNSSVKSLDHAESIGEGGQLRMLAVATMQLEPDTAYCVILVRVVFLNSYQNECDQDESTAGNMKVS